MTAHKTASDMGRQHRKEEKRPAFSSPLPEAFIRAHEGPFVACGELAMEVWDTGLPRTEPQKERK